MSKFIELYKPYNDHLITTLGLDWYEISRVDGLLGNAPGIYPDVGMLIERLVSRPDIETIYEYGSGVSTLYFAAAAQKYGKTFVSFEEEAHWLEITNNLLEHYKILLTTKLYDENDPIHSINPSLIFLDCQPNLRAKLFQIHPSLLKSEWIILDDSEKPGHLIPVLELLAGKSRFNHFWFNPIGRQDRASLINVNSPEFETQQWVWDWRPDKVYW